MHENTDDIHYQINKVSNTSPVHFYRQNKNYNSAKQYNPMRSENRNKQNHHCSSPIGKKSKNEDPLCMDNFGFVNFDDIINEDEEEFTPKPKRKDSRVKFSFDIDLTNEREASASSLNESFDLFTEEDNSNEYIAQAKIFLQDAIKYRSIMHGLDKNSMRVYRIVFSRWFLMFLALAISTLMILPFLENPSSLTITSDIRYLKDRPSAPCGVLESIDFICLLIITANCIMKLYLVRRYSGRSVNNKWLLFQLPLTFIYVIDLLVSLSLKCEERIRIRRYIRLYFLLSNSQMMKQTVSGYQRSFKQMISVSFFMGLMLLATSTGAICLYSKPWNNYVDLDKLAPFNDSFASAYTLFIFTLTSNSPDYLLGAYGQNRINFVYFGFYLMFILYVIMNIFTSIVYVEFKGHLAARLRIRVLKRRVATRAIFDVNYYVNSIDLRKVIENESNSSWWKKNLDQKLIERNSKYLKLEEFMKLFKWVGSKNPYKLDYPVRFMVGRIRCLIQQFSLSEIAAFISLIITFASVVYVTSEISYEHMYGLRSTVILIKANWIFVSLFSIEKSLHLWAHGFKSFIRYPVHILDSAMALIILILKIVQTPFIFQQLSELDEQELSYCWNLERFLIIIFFLRSFRMVLFLSWTRDIFYSVTDFPYTLGPVAAVMWCVYSAFSFLGMSLFEGTITYNATANASNSNIYGAYESNGFWMLNFDDFAASLVTLWSLMIVNNWFIIIDAYKVRLGNGVFAFMITWWIILVIVVLAPITALIIDTFMFRHSKKKKSTRNKRILSVYKMKNASEQNLMDLLFEQILDVSFEKQQKRRITFVSDQLKPDFESQFREMEIQPDDEILPKKRKKGFKQFCPNFVMNMINGVLNHFFEFNEIGEVLTLRRAQYIFYHSGIQPYTHADIFTSDIPEPTEGMLTKAVLLHPYLADLEEHRKIQHHVQKMKDTFESQNVKY